MKSDLWTPQHVETRLTGDTHDAHEEAGAQEKRAAVAVVLRFENLNRTDHRPGAKVLLMRRVTRGSDPWSGQISLPGGGHEPGDEDLVDTAVRETREEVGVDLASSARRLGRLAPMQARARSRRLPLRVWPFVFELTRDVDFVVGPEAEEAFWFPLARAARGELDATYRYEGEDAQREFPSWRHDGRIVWGMTHYMLQSLIAALRP